MQEMRRKDRQGTREDAERILRKETFGVLSTAAMEGYPYGVPINYYYEDGLSISMRQEMRAKRLLP